MYNLFLYEIYCINRKGWVEMKISEALIGKQVILNLSQDSHVLIHPSQH